MLFEGFILGGIAWMSGWLSLWHMPRWLRRFVVNHYVISDITATAIAYLLISSISHSLVAVSACLVAGLLTNFTIMFVRHLALSWWLK